MKMYRAMTGALTDGLHDGLARTLEWHAIGVYGTIAGGRLRQRQDQLEEVDVNLRQILRRLRADIGMYTKR